MSRPFKLALLILAPLLIAVICYYPYSPGGRQSWNMHIAAEHLPKVQTIVDADARFKYVIPGVYTGQDGAIVLNGTVATDDDLCRLMKEVAKARVPITVVWYVEVRPPR